MKPINFILSALCFAITINFTNAAFKADKSSLDQYRAQWSKREFQAKDNASRVILAESLLNAARSGTENKRMTLLLCDRAYLWGARQRSGYGTASQALKLMQKTDPAQRLDCLSRLRVLYEKAYGLNKTANIGLGKGLAKVQIQIAQEYLDRMHTVSNDDENKFITDSITNLRSASRYFALATATLREIDGRVRQLLSNVHIQRNSATVAQLTSFKAELAKIASHSSGHLKKLKPQSQEWMDLKSAKAAFDKTQESDSAGLLAERYLIIGQPHLATNYAQHVTDSRKPLLLAVVKPLAALDPVTANSVGALYADLADRGASADMLIRAKMYFDRAGQNPATRIALGKVNAQLKELGISQKRATRLGRDIIAELGTVEIASAPPEKTDRKTPPPPATPIATAGGERICKKCFSEFTAKSATEKHCAICRGRLENTTSTPPAGETSTPLPTTTEPPPVKKITYVPPAVRACRKCFADFNPRGSNARVCSNCARSDASIFDFE